MTHLLNAILFAVNAVLWGYRGLSENSLFYVILAAVWLAGTCLWFSRYLKHRNQNKEK